MDTQQMISELRHLEEKHRNDKYCTFETNWHLMCHDVANKLDELNKEIIKLRKDRDALNEKCINLMNTDDKYVLTEALLNKLNSMYLPFTPTSYTYECGWNGALDDMVAYINGTEI